MWDLSSPTRNEPVSSALQGEFLTTGPWGKSLQYSFSIKSFKIKKINNKISFSSLNQPKSALLFATRNSGWYSLLEYIPCWIEVILQSDSVTLENTPPYHLSSQSPLKGILLRPPFHLALLSSLPMLTEPHLPSFIDKNMSSLYTPQGLCTCCCFSLWIVTWLTVCYSELTLLIWMTSQQSTLS